VSHLLSIAAQLPYPPDHGQRLRTYHLLTNLPAAWTVSLVCWSQSMDVPPELADRVAEVVVLPLHHAPRTLSARLRRQCRFLAGGDPPYVQEMRAHRPVEPLLSAVHALHTRHPVDVVACEDEAVSRLVPPLLGVPRVVHRVNVFEPLLHDVRRSTLGGRLAFVLDRRGWRRFDRTTLEGADLVIAPTVECATALPPDRSTRVVPSGVEPRRLPTPVRSGHDVVFIGWMTYPPNVHAVRWFVREVWPSLHAQFPDSSFRIVGRDPADEVLALGAAPGVVVTGEVPEVATACAGARLGVAPLWAGLGIKNKTLEMLALGLPVVSSPLGAEGIDTGDGTGLLVAHDASEFGRLAA
jgi:glycosyltransferase involved in cell wall biosynthesis